MEKGAKSLVMIICGVAVALFCGLSWAAETYPSKSLQIIVSFAPGGGVDSVARIVGQKLTESLGQPVLVDNRPGASGMIGTDVAANAPPDGYTLLLGTQTVLVVAPILYGKTTFDPLKLFAPVAMIGSTPPSRSRTSSRSQRRSRADLTSDRAGWERRRTWPGSFSTRWPESRSFMWRTKGRRRRLPTSWADICR